MKYSRSTAVASLDVENSRGMIKGGKYLMSDLATCLDSSVVIMMQTLLMVPPMIANSTMFRVRVRVDNLFLVTRLVEPSSNFESPI